jgi:hypothetical protein
LYSVNTRRHRIWAGKLPNASVRVFEGGLCLAAVLVVVLYHHVLEFGGWSRRCEGASGDGDDGSDVCAKEALAEDLATYEAGCADDDELHCG